MGTKLRLWWNKTSKPRLVIISFLTVLSILLILIILGYLFNWDWTGLTPYKNSDSQPGKTLWDWLQLLIIPAVLALGGYLFNYSMSRNERQTAEQRTNEDRKIAAKRDQTERDIALDNQREEALQAYIAKMSELILEDDLCETNPGDMARIIARTLTLTLLHRLDKDRKRSVIQFLYESNLIKKDKLNVSSG